MSALPQKRTLELGREMSALCQKQTFRDAERTLLFDHLVCSSQQRLRNGQAEQFPISVILFDAMKSLLVLLIALLPLQAQAQEIQLTLNCQIERAHDFKTRQKGPSSGSFSAIVHMSNSQDATIEVTTGFCFNYVGSLSEQEVIGECKRTVGDSKYWAYLTINRLNGEFEHVFTSSGGSAEIEYSEGHCTPGKKLF